MQQLSVATLVEPQASLVSSLNIAKLWNSYGGNFGFIKPADKHNFVTANPFFQIGGTKFDQSEQRVIECTFRHGNLREWATSS
ncbi:hypothetical protein D3C71_2069300 [compost metagenome]